MKVEAWMATRQERGACSGGGGDTFTGVVRKCSRWLAAPNHTLPVTAVGEAKATGWMGGWSSSLRMPRGGASGGCH